MLLKVNQEKVSWCLNPLAQMEIPKRRRCVWITNMSVSKAANMPSIFICFGECWAYVTTKSFCVFPRGGKKKKHNGALVICYILSSGFLEEQQFHLTVGKVFIISYYINVLLSCENHEKCIKTLAFSYEFSNLAFSIAFLLDSHWSIWKEKSISSRTRDNRFLF